ncbi:MAG: toll/interleukin-1 receptor domain-containing protein [Betaproteobacteria bacterium]|nr:MAG: toll/interleukin-1 receptor domain-containing protein [Betaproteobacteria bacterium]
MGRVLNDGLRLGTAYVQFLIANSYQLNQPIFDSHRALSRNERHAMRLVDIKRREIRETACAFRVPAGCSFQHFDIRMQVWNPHRLFDGAHPWKFDDTDWVGGFEVVSVPSTAGSLKVFVSYSWDSEAHKDWVRLLVEQLRKHDIDAIFDQKDLRPGEEATLFMERGISESSVTILICTENYTRKANSREPGGVGFETIISSHEYSVRTPDQRARFIPIIRDNNLPKGRKLPKYLGSTIYVDMSGLNWHAKPMLDLVNAIRRYA